MGMSGAYTGAGGKPGKDTSQGLSDWLDSLVGSPDSGDNTPNPDGTGAGDKPTPGSSDGGDSTLSLDGTGTDDKPATQLPPQVVSGLLGLLRPRSAGGDASDGPGVGGGAIAARGGSATGGSGRGRAGSGRSSRRLASVGGRAGAGAYAFVRGDAVGLRALGLDYTELRALNDPFEVTRRIVNAVCGQQADGRLEEAEERYVAASVADWVLQQSDDGDLPDVDDVARYAIATIIAEVLASELGAALRERPDEIADIAEDELRDAARVLAERAELNASGPTEDELTRAIEDGIDKLQRIYGVRS